MIKIDLFLSSFWWLFIFQLIYILPRCFNPISGVAIVLAFLDCLLSIDFRILLHFFFNEFLCEVDTWHTIDIILI